MRCHAVVRTWLRAASLCVLATLPGCCTLRAIEVGTFAAFNLVTPEEKEAWRWEIAQECDPALAPPDPPPASLAGRKSSDECSVVCSDSDPRIETGP